MRAVLVALLLVAALAGCASAPAPGKGQESADGVPVTTPRETPSGAPPEGTPETPLFALNKTFDGASEPFVQKVHIEKAGWLCIDVDVRATAGSAAVTIVDPAGVATTIASTADKTLHNETVFANDGPGDWTVRINMQGFSGDVGVEILQMI